MICVKCSSPAFVDNQVLCTFCRREGWLARIAWRVAPGKMRRRRYRQNVKDVFERTQEP